ncbi:non-ribosomal peptide synthetase [Sesbania bispinosa]|nr:non-ribosomal peptide synthetase [Sesbania bispinosa]
MVRSDAWCDQAPLNEAVTWPCANDRVATGARHGLVVVFVVERRRHRMLATTCDDHGAALERERSVAKHSNDETDLESFIAVAGFRS